MCVNEINNIYPTLISMTPSEIIENWGYLEVESWQLDFLLVRLKHFANHPNKLLTPGDPSRVFKKLKMFEQCFTTISSELPWLNGNLNPGLPVQPGLLHNTGFYCEEYPV